jgi:hypothetical protein
MVGPNALGRDGGFLDRELETEVPHLLPDVRKSRPIDHVAESERWKGLRSGGGSCVGRARGLVVRSMLSTYRRWKAGMGGKKGEEQKEGREREAEAATIRPSPPANGKGATPHLQYR